MFRLVLTLVFIFSFTSLSFADEKVKSYYFGATWCPPCKKMKYLFKDKEVAKELSKFDFQIYDIDKSPEVKKKYRITKIPTLIFINKEKQTRHVGSMSKQQLLKILSEQIK
jgi:thiol-disulfide isomerase/thioredoxin|tara:strand:+ start:607 stop:939 length:333 start_codon:yes stop_codon:yes gene_type:complete